MAITTDKDWSEQANAAIARRAKHNTPWPAKRECRGPTCFAGPKAKYCYKIGAYRPEANCAC